DVVLRHKLVTLAVFLCTMGLTVLLYATTPTGFFPQQDNGFLGGVAVTSQDSSFAKLEQKIRAVAGVICADPDVASVAFFVGDGGANQANLSISLEPRESGRKASADQIIGRLRSK